MIHLPISARKLALLAVIFPLLALLTHLPQFKNQSLGKSIS